MKHKISYILLGAFLCLLSGIIILGSGEFGVPSLVEASKRTVTYNGELYTTDLMGGMRKLTENQNIQSVFGETEESVLVGKRRQAINSQIGGVDLYLVNKKDGEMRKVTDIPAEFALLDNRKKSVFYLTVDGEIKRHEIATGKEEDIADLASIPSISPDDAYLAFKKMPDGWVPGEYSDGSPGVVIKEIETGKERVLTNKEADHAAYWTPDGKHLYFFGDNGYGLDSLFLIDADGENRTLLTNVDVMQYNAETIVPSISEPPIISSDGRYFVYESDREIWLIDVDVEQRKMREARRVGYGTNPAWEDDGKTISIVVGGSKRNEKASIIVVDLEGNIIER